MNDKLSENGNMEDAEKSWKHFQPLFEYHDSNIIAKLCKIGKEIKNG